MKLIKPAEIAAKIMTLIDEADEELIIVSAYNNLSDWDKLQKHFQGALRRKINMNYYVRANEYHKGLDDLGIKPTPIENLHAKFYMNEKYAIVTSMNLVLYSDTYSLDIGYLTENERELNDLKEYYERFIKPHDNSYKNSIPCLTGDIINETVFLEYFDKFVELNDYNLKFEKNYHQKSCFIKSCGYMYKNLKIGYWIYFDNNGFVSKHIYHDEDGSSTVNDIILDDSISRYFILFSIANIISAIYQVSIQDLYFRSALDDYMDDNAEKLFKYLEKHLNIHSHDYDLNIFEQLNDVVLWYLKGNEGRCDYFDNITSI